MAKSRILGTETPEPIDTKFCMSSVVHDVITHANCCDDRLRVFGVAVGRILAISINLLRRFYDTLALLCECVIVWLTIGPNTVFLFVINKWLSYIWCIFDRIAYAFSTPAFSVVPILLRDAPSLLMFRRDWRRFWLGHRLTAVDTAVDTDRTVSEFSNLLL